jgi:Flp pilus assembly pilin Flp
MRHRKGERGQGLVEYSLPIALVAITAVAALSMMGRSFYSIFYGISEALQFGCGQVSAETFRHYASPHLHFEIRLGSELVDPASHLP